MKKYKSNREEKMSEIQERLMAGTKEIYESGKWAEYISVMSKFPHYSINNCILIASQCPHASYYEIIVTDFAGNITRKKLTSQYSLLTWFHTSIDRSSYNR